MAINFVVEAQTEVNPAVNTMTTAEGRIVDI
jgi:hypothetical protein